jgi:hypothetical protein
MAYYRTVFVITDKHPPFLLLIMIALMIVLSIALVIKMRRSAIYIALGSAVFLTGLLFGMMLLSGLVLPLASNKADLVAGRYRLIDGAVKGFRPMPWDGRQESFTVGDIKFSYSDYVLTPCFNNTASHGGLMRAGLRVRISYIDDCILKIEIVTE